MKCLGTLEEIALGRIAWDMLRPLISLKVSDISEQFHLENVRIKL